jgi:thiazole/oxazole-forming peptide maturase SagD family component
MRIRARPSARAIASGVERLSRRMVHPLCGLDSRVGFVLRGRYDPRFAVAGGQLSGVHRLLGHDEAGSYHIGGVGLTRTEALVRTLGESVERYCQLVSVVGGTRPVHVATRSELSARGAEFVDPCESGYFSDAQHERPGFPFDRADPEAPYGWIATTRLPDRRQVLVPAQLALVGYTHRAPDEPWLFPAMTTGTATHTTYALAARGALLELAQVDVAMGHWYGRCEASRIGFGRRLSALGRLVEARVAPYGRASFHYLPRREAPVHGVACVFRPPSPRIPSVAVGLGCELRLAEACYKALLEAVGVFQLAKIAMVTGASEGRAVGVVDESGIYDLDSNVAHYASAGGDDVLEHKFPTDGSVHEDELPPDVDWQDADVPQRLIDAFVGQGIGLYECDLTTVDAAQLGMVTPRFWSPDLLPLALPSAPLAGHRRFDAYGGVANERPHPYP